MDYIKIRFGNDFERLTSRFEKTFEDMFRPRPASPMFATGRDRQVRCLQPLNVPGHRQWIYMKRRKR
jgi:hypothetical protein